MSEMDQQSAPAQAPATSASSPPGQPYFPDPVTPPAPAPQPATPATPLDHLAAFPQYADEHQVADTVQASYGADASVDTQGANARAHGDLTWRPGPNTMIKTGAETHAGTDGVGGRGDIAATHTDGDAAAKARAAVAVTPDGAVANTDAELKLQNEKLRLELAVGAQGLGGPNPTGHAAGDAAYTTPDFQAGAGAGVTNLGGDPQASSHLDLGVGDPKGLSLKLAADMQNMTDDQKRTYAARLQGNIPLTKSTSIQPSVAVRNTPGSGTTGEAGVDVTQQITPSVGVKGGVNVQNIGGPGGPEVVPNGGVIITPPQEQKPNPTGPLPPPSF